jgi:hypothetical protein
MLYNIRCVDGLSVLLSAKSKASISDFMPTQRDEILYYLLMVNSVPDVNGRTSLKQITK